MRSDVTILDGAVGTSLWEKAQDKVAVWRYNVENPDIVRQLASEYVEAGAQIVLANTCLLYTSQRRLPPAWSTAGTSGTCSRARQRYRERCRWAWC